MRLLITGASGYIGLRLTKVAIAQGHKVLTASRRRVMSATSWVPYELQSGIAPAVNGPLDAIIHLAANTSPLAHDHGAGELVAVQALVKLAHTLRARLIFVSSQAAAASAPTSYGRIKWLLEQEIVAARGFIVRPGLVYGGPLHGLFETLTNAVRQLPAMPAFLPAPMVQPVHVDDLATGLLTLAAGPGPSNGILCVAAREPIGFTQFLQTIADSRLRRRALFVPMPTFLVRVALRLTPPNSRARGSLERLTSLFELCVVDSEPSLQALGLVLRPLASGMQPSGSERRRLLLAEGAALLAYVLKMKPASGVVRRHVRVIERLRGGQALHLPRLLKRWPLTIALFDTNAMAADAAWQDEFKWRLHAATAIGEATVQGAQRFLAVESSEGMLGASWRLCGAVAAELIWRTLAIALKPWLRRERFWCEAQR